MDFLTKKHRPKLIRNFLLIIIGLVFFSFVYNFVSADSTSTNFQLENPVDIIEGGQASSPSFQYFSSTDQLTSGQNISSSSFSQTTGAVSFPVATSPVVSATPADAQVVLTWTAATGIFANITSYSVGISTTSGGTFTYTTVGNVLTSTRTSLTNGTAYFFKIRSYAAGVLLSESAEVSATPVSSSTPPAPAGGAGGGASSASGTGVNFSGRAYPLSKVTILKDGQLAISTIAGPDSNFNVSITDLSDGNYTFSVYGEDKNGVRSSPFSFPITITSGATTNIGGIFIAPTISVDKSEVKKGDNITIFGQSSPSSKIIISVNSEQAYFGNETSDANGVYLHNFDTSVLEMGQHSTKSKAQKSTEISPFGNAVGFIVGTKNVLADNTKKEAIKGDLNGDSMSNLVDFSIAAFWYKKANPPAKVDLNHDGVVNLVDFSIMAFYWTG